MKRDYDGTLDLGKYFHKTAIFSPEQPIKSFSFFFKLKTCHFLSIRNLTVSTQKKAPAEIN